MRDTVAPSLLAAARPAPTREHAQAIVAALPRARGAACGKRALLVTGPHACQASFPDDDPFSDALALALHDSAVRRGGACDAACVLARVSRAAYDQNRLVGLLEARDMWPRLEEWRTARGGSLRDVLHVDMHTYTGNAAHLPEGWGRGLNFICLHGDLEQRRLAETLARAVDATPGWPLPPSTVVPMGRLPRSLDDDDGNAQIEWARHHGALSVLVECPVYETGVHDASPRGRGYVRATPDAVIADALARALAVEMRRRRRRDHISAQPPPPRAGRTLASSSSSSSSSSSRAKASRAA